MSLPTISYPQTDYNVMCPRGGRYSVTLHDPGAPGSRMVLYRPRPSLDAEGVVLVVGRDTTPGEIERLALQLVAENLRKSDRSTNRRLWEVSVECAPLGCGRARQSHTDWTGPKWPARTTRNTHPHA